MDWGAFTKGLAGGIRAAEEQSHKRELLKLQKRKLDLEDKESELKIGELKRKITQAEQLGTLGNEFAGADSYQTKADYLTPTTGQENPPTQDVSGFDPSAKPSRTSKDVLRELVVRSGHPEKLLDKPGTTPEDIASTIAKYKGLLPETPTGYRTNINAGGKVSMLANLPDQVPKGETSRQMYHYYSTRIPELKAASISDSDAYAIAKREWDQMSVERQQAQSGGRERGKITEQLYGTGADFPEGYSAPRGQVAPPASRTPQATSPTVAPTKPAAGATTAPGLGAVQFDPSVSPQEQAIIRGRLGAGQPVTAPAGQSPYMQLQHQKAAATREESALPAGVEDALARGGTLSRLIGRIREDFKPEYLGPAKGTSAGLAVRRTFGSVLQNMGATEGSWGKMPPREIAFRQNLASANNLIIYLQTGKQINEQEADRLIAVLPAATDEPGVFPASLDRFEQEMQTILEEHRKAASMSRGQLLQPGAIPPPSKESGWRPTRRPQ